MWHPAHVDGRTVVVIRAHRSFLGGFDVVERGRLEHDGTSLSLARDDGRRVVSDAERDALQPVTEHNRIDACRGFDFFLLADSED